MSASSKSTLKAYPEHAKLKAAKAGLRLDTIAEILDLWAACRLPYHIVRDNETLWELALPCNTDRAAYRAFMAWVDAQPEERFPRDRYLYPSAPMFAEYAAIDLKKLDCEKGQMLEVLRTRDMSRPRESAEEARHEKE